MKLEDILNYSPERTAVPPVSYTHLDVYKRQGNNTVRTHFQNRLDESGIVDSHPNDRSCAGVVGGDNALQDFFFVKGAVLGVDPDKIVSPTGHFLGNGSVGEKNMAADS